MIDLRLLRRKVREERYSVTTLASAMGLSRTTMARKLSGQRDFKCSEAQKIASLLGLSDLEVIEIFFARK